MTELEMKFFNSLLEDEKVKHICFRHKTIEWIDGYTGKKSVYHPSFTIIYNDSSTEHIEVIYPRIPHTKYLYAQNNCENWRMINDKELMKLGITPNEKIKWWL